jgi:hypothetical protein
VPSLSKRNPVGSGMNRGDAMLLAQHPQPCHVEQPQQRSGQGAEPVRQLFRKLVQRADGPGACRSRQAEASSRSGAIVPAAVTPYRPASIAGVCGRNRSRQSAETFASHRQPRKLFKASR